MDYNSLRAAVLAAQNTGKAANRICAELRYLEYALDAAGKNDEGLLEKAYRQLNGVLSAEGVITESAADEAEKILLPLSPVCKSFKGIMVSHAHIDMNWMWGYNETVSVTVDTFRTVLDLMKEYPDFTYAQSQGSTYRIIEKFAPEMLEEIKQRVHEGRWELSASTWVEPDKNMPSGESLSRHILYTKRYLSKLFDVSPDSLRLDFEPDTFGHNMNVPEILQNGGVDYYYHCRGYDGYNIYNWEAPSGKKVLVFREPNWYNDEINTEKFIKYPAFCKANGIDTFLAVYGVGDHGGGPTRRDLERIIAYSKYPLFPDIRFGTYHEFFDIIAKQRDSFPTVKGELNYVFTGCYTSQSRIKAANRYAEDRIYESEQLCAEANALAGLPKKSALFAEAWENILFNHFHDILPGSGTIETREYAMGHFQDAMGHIEVNANAAMKAIAAKIDTSAIDFDRSKNTVSEGGGVGFATDAPSGYLFSHTDRGSGKTRVVCLFNSTMYDRSEPVEITLWDYPGDISRVYATSPDGDEQNVICIEKGSHYWGHRYTKVVFDAFVPAFGYSTYVLRERTQGAPSFPCANDPNPRTDNYIRDDAPVLENEFVRAVFDPLTLAVTSFTDKETGCELASPNGQTGTFNYILENTRYGMTSWRVGPYMKVENLNTAYPVRILGSGKDSYRSLLSYRICFASSVLDVTVMLKHASRTLEYNVKCDWHEVGNEKAVPQLSFYAPVSYKPAQYRYDVPFGIIERPDIASDVPGNSFIQPLNPDGRSLAVITDTKYGFRGHDDSASVTLIRSSYDPDPYPEFGIHRIRLGLASSCKGCIKKLATGFVHPIPFTAVTEHTGSLPLTSSLFKVDGNVMTDTVKNPEDGEGVIIRLSEYNGAAQEVKITFCRDIVSAQTVDFNEKPVDALPLSTNGNTLSFSVPAYTTVSILIK